MGGISLRASSSLCSGRARRGGEGVHRRPGLAQVALSAAGGVDIEPQLRQPQRQLLDARLVVHGDQRDHAVGAFPRRYASERYFVTPVSTSVNPASAITGPSASRLAPCVWPNIDSRGPKSDW